MKYFICRKAADTTNVKDELEFNGEQGIWNSRNYESSIIGKEKGCSQLNEFASLFQSNPLKYISCP